MRTSTKFVALDLHKDSIAVALTVEGPKGPNCGGPILSTYLCDGTLGRRLPSACVSTFEYAGIILDRRHSIFEHAEPGQL